MVMDLAKTLEGLSAAATRARVLESRVANRWQITLDFGDDRDAMRHFSDLYRTGQLIVVDHPQATSPVDDRGGAVCEQQDAARYRWLRDHSCPPHNFYISVPDEFHDVRYALADVDAYIDAARQALGDEA